MYKSIKCVINFVVEKKMLSLLFPTCLNPHLRICLERGRERKREVDRLPLKCAPTGDQT